MLVNTKQHATSGLGMMTAYISKSCQFTL